MNVIRATSMRAVMQADAPTATGYGINWYGGPVLNNKAGIVVSLPSAPVAEGSPFYSPGDSATQKQLQTDPGQIASYSSHGHTAPVLFKALMLTTDGILTQDILSPALHVLVKLCWLCRAPGVYKTGIIWDKQHLTSTWYAWTAGI